MIAYLPLDSRPCNTRFVRQLTGHAGHTLLMPSESRMDYFVRPAPFEESRRFLESLPDSVSSVIVSIDHLCYGSLIASRADTVTLAEAEKRLELLIALKKRNKNRPIHAVSIIQRASISTVRKEDLPVYEAMIHYSALQGRPDRAEEAQFWKEKIPESILEHYLQVRARNHAINSLCLKYVQDGILDTLQLLQEDAQPYGFHRREQEALWTQIREMRIQDRVYLRNGADEGGMLMAMRALRPDSAALPLTVFADRGGTDFISAYEDRPFTRNLRDAMRYLNIAESTEAPCVLWIHTPPEGIQKEAAFQTDADEPDLPLVLVPVRGFLDSGRRVYLLDICFANGGSLPLAKALQDQGILDRLSGYSAWNTSSNALGTILAQFVSDSIASSDYPEFTRERLLDDLMYQSLLRNRLNTKLRSLGEDVYRLDSHSRAERLLTEMYTDAFPASPPEIHLPWPRTFEIDLRLREPPDPFLLFH